MTTLRLYHSANTRSFRALWALEEVGVDYDLVMLAFPPRDTDPSYLSINPLGTVPLLLDGDVRMTESAAICQYLADLHPDAGIGVSPGDPRYGPYLNALHHGEATLTFPQAVYLRYSVFEPEERRSEQVADDYRQWFRARLKLLGTLLEGGAFVAGDRFTAADISVGYAIMLANLIGLGNLPSAEQRDYFDRLSSRPAFVRALARQDEGNNP